MAYYGIGLDTTVQRLIFEFRSYTAKSSPHCSVSGLRAMFQTFDRNNNGKLELREFDEALKSVGFFLKIHELQALIKFFDQNGDGCISYNELLEALRQPLNERRLTMVQKVFNSLDENQQGFISSESINSVEARFNQKKTQIQFADLSASRMLEYLSSPSQLSFDDFQNFYIDLSMKIPSDDAFIELLKKTWDVEEKIEDNVFKQDLLKALNDLHQTVLNRSKGIENIQKVFKEFDLNRSNYLSLTEFEVMLTKLQFSLPQKLSNQMFVIFDRNRSGFIEYEEFVAFFSQTISQ